MWQYHGLPSIWPHCLLSKYASFAMRISSANCPPSGTRESRAYSRTITMEASGSKLVKVEESFSEVDEEQSS